MIANVTIAAAGLGAASLAGSLIGLVVKRIPHRWNDIFMGFCAGTMLAASIVGLIAPAVSEAGVAHWWQVVAGVALGVALIGMLDYVTPHLHRLTGLDPEQHRGDTSTHRILLFVMAIALHKLPEGMAAGIVFDDVADMSNAWSVAISISLQNIPEGMVVVTPLLMIGVGFWRSFGVGLSVAMLEIAGVWLGYMLGSVSGMFMPALLGMAGGAMLYVISDEMIPETHSHGYQKPATFALVAGVLAMLFIDALAA